MPVETRLTAEGFVFSIYADKTPVEFPMEIRQRPLLKLIQSAAGDQVLAVERLYLNGIIDQVQSGQYILPHDRLHELDSETTDELQLPKRPVELTLKEIGHFGSDRYQITFEANAGPRTLFSPSRNGPVLSYDRQHYLLNASQWRLLEELERWQDPGRGVVVERARHQARIKSLAKQANVAIDSFMAARESVFADTVDVQLRKKDDQHVRVVPSFKDIPDAINETLFAGVSGTDVNQPHPASAIGHSHNLFELQHNGVRKRVFVDDSAEQTVQEITALPEITGKNVPRFMDNPAAFLPETIEYDPEVFAKRVKGLKILRSTVVPYVNLSVSADRPGWFDLDTGIRVETDEGSDLVIPDDSDTTSETGAQASEPAGEPASGNTSFGRLDDQIWKDLERTIDLEPSDQQAEDYVYNPDLGWVNYQPDSIAEYRQAKKQLRELGLDEGPISPENLNRVLDIYTNLNSLDYNEGFIQNRKALADIQRVPYEPIPGLRASLFDYQQEGYRWLRGLGEAKLGGLLADDMGLGKTLQIISYLLYRQSQNILRPSLVVVPLSLMENWYNEIAKFAPSLLPVAFYSGLGRRHLINQIENYDLIITTYETLARDQLLLARIHWKLIVSDETQKIKNYKTRASHAAKGMHAEQRIAMTGTPVENRLSELWSIIDFIQPGLLRSYSYFRKAYETPIMTGAPESQQLTDELIETIRPVFLRRTKDELFSKELPPPHLKRSFIPMTQTQFAKYQEIVRSFDLNANPDPSQRRMVILAALQKLLQLCSHPRLLDGSSEMARTKDLLRESPKLSDTIEILKSIRKSGEKVLIFTTWHKMQRILRQVILEEFGVNAPIINGEIKSSRQAIVDQFNQTPGFHVMILSPKAAGIGLNITGANHVIHYSREWNPAIENQATGRAHRIGQKKIVSVYYPITVLPNAGLVARHQLASQGITVEQRLDMLLEDKRTLMRNVVVPNGLEIQPEAFVDLL